MKKLLFLVFLSMVSFHASAYNKGLTCITYLSKNGSLTVGEHEKFHDSDLELILDYMASRFNIDRPKVVREKPVIYARGLGDDRNSYPRIKIVNEDLYFQNGIFYYERSGDGVKGMIGQFESVIGGVASFYCRKDEE